MDILIMLLVGAFTGWIGSFVFPGNGLGIFGNIVAGLVGSVITYWAFGALGVSLGTGIIPAVLTGILGAIIFIAIVNLLYGARTPS
ncbi:MAG TPA: GlsB/YeaQ/YmgE family stress response membrane protein [Flavobacterium sp.]|nr:GlsB/YeaQ/YmgE family stress response membrane protein [Flavobacterium sp.]